MSTDLITYLNYMSNWENEPDADIQTMIDEQQLFKGLGDFNSDDAVDSEFKTLVNLAEKVRDETIAADAIQMSADAAAVASYYSFGMSMAYFVVAEATEALLKMDISEKSKELNEKLTTADVDIAANIDSNVSEYVKDYKKNNNLINSQSPKGLDNQQARANLMQFMAQCDKRFKDTGGLTVANFKTLAASARIAYASDEINAIYDALDELNLSGHTDEDLKKFMNALVGFKIPGAVRLTIGLVQGLAVGILRNRMKIADNKIQEAAEEAEVPVEEYEASTFEMMDGWGKFALGVVVVMSVIDVVMNIIDIVDIVKQTAKMVDELNDKIKPSYKSYFNSIKEASQSYNKAIADK